jgi:hypothetical protein
LEYTIWADPGVFYKEVDGVRKEELIRARRADARLVSAVARLQAGIALFAENDRLVMATRRTAKSIR